MIPGRATVWVGPQVAGHSFMEPAPRQIGDLMQIRGSWPSMGTRGYAVPATQLVEIFGDGWRQTVYA